VYEYTITSFEARERARRREREAEAERIAREARAYRRGRLSLPAILRPWRRSQLARQA
jgi:hypothetical protein